MSSPRYCMHRYLFVIPFFFVLIAPFARRFYALDVPTPLAWLAVVGGSVLAIGGLIGTDDRFIPGWILHRWSRPG